jgi:hypothetical protein
MLVASKQGSCYHACGPDVKSAKKYGKVVKDTCRTVLGCEDSYQRFGGPCCFYLHPETDTARSSETLVSYITICYHNSRDRDLNLHCHSNLKFRSELFAVKL